MWENENSVGHLGCMRCWNNDIRNVVIMWSIQTWPNKGIYHPLRWRIYFVYIYIYILSIYIYIYIYIYIVYIHIHIYYTYIYYIILYYIILYYIILYYVILHVYIGIPTIVTHGIYRTYHRWILIMCWQWITSPTRMGWSDIFRSNIAWCTPCFKA